MSHDDFFGRPIPSGRSAIEFDLCEVCERKTPQWLETQFDSNPPVVRFVCSNCHEDFNREDTPDEEKFTRQISDDDEIPDVTRPGWVDEFIEEQQKSGSIQSINLDDEVENLGDDFSEPPPSFLQEDDTSSLEPEPRSEDQIASWAPKFIQEALFGENPETWLEEQGAFKETNLTLTIKTLKTFKDHDVGSVKLSAIQCLLGLFNRHPSKKTQVLEGVNMYVTDDDPTVSEFAKQIIDQIT